MNQHATTTCRFLEVEADGTLVLQVGAERMRATLRGARIAPSKAGQANAFLAERAPRVNLRCAIRDPGPPAVVDVELRAWRDKSGDVWQDLGAALIKQGLAEPYA